MIAKKGERRLLIEVHVTHAVSENKADKIRQAKLSCLEIHLGQFRGWNDLVGLKEVILHDAPRHWIVNQKQEELVALAAEKERIRVKRENQALRQRELNIQQRKLKNEKSILERRMRLPNLLLETKKRIYKNPPQILIGFRNFVEQKGYANLFVTSEWMCQFVYPPEYWQSAILKNWFMMDMNFQERIPMGKLWESFCAHDNVLREFIYTSKEDVEYVQQNGIPSFVRAYDLVKNFIQHVNSPGKFIQ